MLKRFAIQCCNVSRRFAGARDGNFAMIMGLLMVPLLIGAGMAIDLGRSGHARASIQEATDAALLRVARLKTSSPNLTDAELTAKARKIFDAAIQGIPNVDVSAFAVEYHSDTEEFTLEARSTIPSSLMGAVGVRYLPVNTLSAVKLGKPPYLEVVMVLDNTGSMGPPTSKLADLKDSATTLVNSLFVNPAAQVKVGLVPFAKYVNVGASNKNASWMGATTPAWTGCVGSRDYPANLEDSDYATNRIPAVDGVSCPDAIFPMSANKSAILSAINGMNASGSTYIPAGLAWGWRVLTSGAPFTEGVTYDVLEEKIGVKSLIVLTDGENTAAPDYPKHDNPDRSLADELMLRLCDNIKAEGIVIYSIAFDVTDALIRGQMEDCATSPGHYFDPATDDELAEAFESIATSLRSLSLSK